MNRNDRVKTDLGRVNSALRTHGVELHFIEEAVDDLTSYDMAKRKEIYSHIVRRATSGPLLKPDGIGEPLRSPLNGFAKIKPRALGIRIIYRAREADEGIVRMEVIAVGPRDRDKVYKMAEKRLESFHEKMGK